MDATERAKIQEKAMDKERLRLSQEAVGESMCEAMDIEVLRKMAIDGGGSRVRTSWKGAAERILNGASPSQERLDMALIWAASVPLESWRISGLLAAGASLAAKKAKGWRSPLLLATKVGNCEAMKILIEAGADVDEIDDYGDSALSWAACNRLGALRILAPLCGSSHEERDENGMTPAMLAIGHGDAEGECLRLLLPFANLSEHGEEMANWASEVMQDPEPALQGIQRERGRRSAIAEAEDLRAHVEPIETPDRVKKSNAL